jgi:eukaryotic-like serine/threonine-protein kinase
MVLDPLGQGGMAVVYRAFDPELDRSVALKLLLPASSESGSEQSARTRFLREAQAMAHVSHPNVIEVYDVGIAENQAFIAMKLVDGGTLKEWLKVRRPWREVVDAYLQAGRGLDAAHRAGLVHRDFKPSNVLRGKDGHVSVTDFGLARLARASDDSPPARPITVASPSLLSTDLSQMGHLAGTAGYIAPERYAGRAPDPRSDQFSFCVSLYEGLYGALPFSPMTILKALAPTLKEGAAAAPGAKDDGLLSALAKRPGGPEVPGHLRRILERGLRTDPDGRFPSMEALLEQLGRDPARARRRLLALGGATLAVACAVGLAAWSVQRSKRLCAGAEEHLAGAWDAEVRTKAEHAFAATGLPYAKPAWNAAAAALERHAQAWVRQRTEACQATRIRGEQSDEVLSLRMICLDQRLQELSALTHVLGEADAHVVDRAPQAISALTPLDVCSRVASLREMTRMPVDPEMKSKVEGGQKLVAEARALAEAGRNPDAVARAAAALAQAEASGYPPLRAQAALVEGLVLTKTGDADGAERSLYQAFRGAEVARDDRTRAEAADLLTFVVGYEKQNPAQGHVWHDITEAVLERLGGDDDLRLRALAHLNGLYFTEHKMRQLLEPQKEVVRLREKLSGEDSAETIVQIMNLGNAYAFHGDYDEGIAQWQRAADLYKAHFGESHPQYASALHNISDTRFEQGRFEEAYRLSQQAVALMRAARPAMDATRMVAEMGLARERFALGDRPAGLEAIQTNLAGRRKAFPPDSNLVADALCALTEAYRALGRSGDAVPLLTEAIALRDKPPLSDHGDLVPLFTELGECELALSRPRDAVAPLQRAVRLSEEIGDDPAKEALTRFALARALWESGSRSDALPQAQAALSPLQKAHFRRADDVEAWLRAHHP